MKEVDEKAAARRKRMQPHEEGARKEKGRNLELQNKLTTQGKSYAQIKREMSEIIERENKMIKDIEDTVRSLDRSSSLMTHKFHIIHVNYYCRLENGTYFPCELGLAEFNLRDGITKTYHTLINPGGIPIGYNYQAKKYSEESHNIPVPPEEFGGELDHPKILEQVEQFVMEDNPYMSPLYTAIDSIEPVKNVLWRIQKCVNPGLTTDEHMIAVYSLPKLFYELRNASASSPDAGGFPYYSLAERELEKDVLNFTKGISCNFHEETDALPYCSLSCVRCWSFLILKHYCKDLEIKMLPDLHYARNSSYFQRSDLQREKTFLNIPCDYHFLVMKFLVTRKPAGIGKVLEIKYTACSIQMSNLRLFSISQISSGDTMPTKKFR